MESEPPPIERPDDPRCPFIQLWIDGSEESVAVSAMIRARQLPSLIYRAEQLTLAQRSARLPRAWICWTVEPERAVDGPFVGVVEIQQFAVSKLAEWEDGELHPVFLEFTETETRDEPRPDEEPPSFD